MTLADAALLYGPNEALAHPAAPVVLRQAALGLVGRVETRLELHSNPSEAPGGPFGGNSREEAGVTGWWFPFARGPRIFGSVALRQRQFVTGYQPDGVSSFAASVAQPVYGPVSLYGGGAGVIANGGFPTRGLGDLFLGLAAEHTLGSGLRLAAGYQADRVLDPGALSFTAHALRASAAYNQLAPWRFEAEDLAQLRFLDGGSTALRNRVSLAGERPLWRMVWAGLEARAIANLELGGQPGFDFVLGPRVRCEF